MLVRHFGMVQRLARLSALAIMLPAGVHAASALHRYTFNDGTVNDSIGTANGTLVDPTGNFGHFNAGRLDLSANTGAGPANPITSTNGAFAQLPNGLFTSSVTGGAISLEMWANVSTNRANSRLWSFGSTLPNDTNPYWGQFTDWVDLNAQNGSGNLALTTHEGSQGFNVNEAQQTGVLSAGTLHQVVATLDANDTQSGVNPDGTMRLYVDKVLTATQAISPFFSLSGFDDNENDNFLGRSQWGDPLFDGQIDQFTVYGGALSQTDINNSFATGPVPTPIPTFVIDRATGEVRVENHTSIAFKLKSYSIASAAGGLDVAHWNSITDTGDSNSGGSFDPTGIWSKQSSLNTQLAESTTTAGGQLAAATGTRSLGDAWFRTPFQDLQVTFVLGDGSTGTADVSYVGNAIARSDLNGDGAINAADWTIFLANTNKSFAGQSPVAAYLGGDLNGDLVNDFRDFRLFQHDFIAANSQAAFAALNGANIPEPSTLILAAMGLAGLTLRRRCRKTFLLFAGATCAVSIFCANVAMAATATSFVASADPNMTPDANAGAADAWIVTPTGTGGSGSGFFVPGATSGLATPWAMFSYPVGGVNGVIQADHSLDGGTLSVGQSVRIGIANRAVAAAGGSVGVSLTSSGAVVATLKFNGGDPNGVYRYDDAGGTDLSTGEPFAYETGQTFEFSLNSPTTYTAAYGLSSWNGTISSPVDGVRVFNNGGGDGSDLSFNNLTIGPTTLVQLTLEVNKSNGNVKIKGNPSLAANVDYYQISSVAGALDQVHWNSLDQQNLFAVDGSDPGSVAGDSPTEGWDKSPTATSGQLTEYFLRSGGAAITSGSTQSLGSAYNTSVFGGADGDLQFTYGIAGGVRLTGVVTYVTSAGVVGDYNGNGVVDAADYTVWRDHLGQTFALPNRDPLNSNAISTADYNSWKSHFGASGSGASLSDGAVPEPSTAILLMLGVFLLLLRRGR
jgi:hypothetical protein